MKTNLENSLSKINPNHPFLQMELHDVFLKNLTNADVAQILQREEILEANHRSYIRVDYDDQCVHVAKYPTGDRYFKHEAAGSYLSDLPGLYWLKSRKYDCSIKNWIEQNLTK